MTKVSYKRAINWIAANDDNEWLDDEPSIESVTVSMVAELWGRPIELVTGDLRRELKRRT